MMVATLEVGASITSRAARRVAEIIGWRKTPFSGAVVFVVGGAIQSFATSFKVMVLGRISSARGVGLLSTLVTIYWSEDSPAEHLSLLDALRVQVEYDSVY